MGFLERLKKIVIGSTDRVVEDIEKGNVDEVYRGIIAEEETKYSEVMQLAREAKGFEFQISEKIEGHTKEKKELEMDLKQATKENNEAIGTLLIEKMDTLDAQIAQSKIELENAQKESIDIIEAKSAQEKHLMDLKAEHQNAKVTVKAGEILEKIRQRKNGIGLDPTDKSLENVRAKVAESKATRAADNAIESTSLEHQVSEMRKRSASSSAADRFKAMVEKPAETQV